MASPFSVAVLRTLYLGCGSGLERGSVCSGLESVGLLGCVGRWVSSLLERFLSSLPQIVLDLSRSFLSSTPLIGTLAHLVVSHGFWGSSHFLSFFFLSAPQTG